jgi:CO/xanthine dehydrogenase FAD-binding subunit
MEFLQPGTWAEALQMKAAHPRAVPIQGGTDVMVELNFDRYRPEYLLDLTRVSELRQWAPDNGRIWLGAGVTYTRILTELGGRLPGLAMAARTVGSPQIRNRGTAGGNRQTPQHPGHQQRHQASRQRLTPGTMAGMGRLHRAAHAASGEARRTVPRRRQAT